MKWTFRKKKSFVMVRNLIVAEIVAYTVFMLLALSADWANLYQETFLSDYLSFTVLEFAGLGIFQVLLVLVVVTRSIKEEQHIGDIIRSGEHEHLEFKSSFRWDTQRNTVNKELERSVMKTIAAFLNSDGGSLVIGLDDRKQVLGLEPDLRSLTKSNHDGFENHFNNIFVSMIGPEFRQHARLSFHDLEDKKVCLVRVEPARQPAYLKTDRGEDFFIRTGNATTALKMSQVPAYISTWRR